MRRIVRMAILQLWDNMLESIQHVEVRARIEIGDCERRRGVQHVQLTYPVLARVVRPQHTFHFVGDIENLALLMGPNAEFLHMTIIVRCALCLRRRLDLRVVTPAMEAAITDHIWNLRQLLA